MQPNQAYDVDLAYIHDAGFGDFARNSAPALLRVLADCGGASNLVIDLGCGSGITARLLVDAGYQILGVDVSAAMIELARQRVPDGEFHIGSFVDFRLPACRAVTAMSEVFNYLFDPDNSLATLGRVFQNIFAALIPGGAFIFDIAEPGRCRGRKQAFFEAADWACLVEFQHDEPRHRLTRKIVTFRRVGDTYRRHEETHRQQLYQRADVAERLRTVGFQTEIAIGYDELRFPDGLAAFIARKPL